MNSIESIYYVISWLCHRQCRHCYEDRFRPYHGAERDGVINEAQNNFARIIDHFPDRMRYRDPEDVAPNGTIREKTGRIILSGGEVLVPGVREAVLYPAIERIVDRYRNVGRVKVIVQTTGDLVTAEIVDDLLSRGVWMISVSGMDDFHEGMTGDRRNRLMDHLTNVFQKAGLRRSAPEAEKRQWQEEAAPLYNFFGATPDAWIGKIWPRGRAWRNEVSTATFADNFCNAWSGGLNFLNLGYAGSEVSVEPNGNVYPCCIKTKLPIGNLLEERLMDILQSLVGHPVFEAISMGHPERMGIRDAWTVDRFLEESKAVTPAGRPYQNLCVGCDRFHEQVLGPVLAELRRGRLSKRESTPATS